MINPNITIEQLNAMSKGNMGEHLGLEFTEIGTHHLCAKMPVDHRTHQPMGLLHGGASVVLAETLGSVGAMCCLNPEKQYCVGLEINANHVSGVRDGYVYGKASAVHIGGSTHIWEIRITTETGKLVCISRITMAILNHKK
ncbi:1,4-dihydroxy-2-naphthoyl-CoA hydrolase [Flexibacter flexilis DSM 6793]|uniref:1,4-dihydroxy-2-naphthoyl-CoA hydrolase n=1 Tax=Flexibacter flexilis DSM 6793 TaxID=927664 RepID=A0A1I1IA70_9BACT|nr:hotdog fold thioesterase [Flexibacter flexilis]SFC32931.1 1,4-dihydroxy-2-naphthoyl-CoA hydrolase [Flexibacter flexilis DSM 6793]